MWSDKSCHCLNLWHGFFFELSPTLHVADMDEPNYWRTTLGPTTAKYEADVFLFSPEWVGAPGAENNHDP